MSTTSTSFVPAPLDERSQWLDALRGFALLGILMYNIMAFGGYIFQGLLPPAHHAWAAFDPALDYLAHTLIEGKFYSLFSFLFGLGFALQWRRAQSSGAPGMPMLRRRMAWLLVFGVAHALLLWLGDILAVYAVFGFALLWFGGLSQRALLGWALFFLAFPVLIYPVLLILQPGDPLGGDPATSPVGRAVHAMASGSYLDVVRGNVDFYPSGWLRRIVRLTVPRIFGMFLLGVWAARIGLPAMRDAHRPLLRRWLLWGLSLGLPLNMAYAALGSSDATLPASLTGLCVTALASLGIPLLCVAYVSAFALFWRRPQPGNLLVTAGRTALSHYLGQSVVCVTLFYGFGFGLFDRVSYGVSLLIAIAVFVLLACLGRLWLQRFPQGPMEALWRRLSYGDARSETAVRGSQASA